MGRNGLQRKVETRIELRTQRARAARAGFVLRLQHTGLRVPAWVPTAAGEGLAVALHRFIPLPGLCFL